MKCNIVERLGDTVNVHGTVKDNDVIIKMNSKFGVDGKTEIRVAADSAYARFFNESTTNAITPGHNAYEEAPVAVSPDEEKVVIVKTEPKGFLSKLTDAIKSRFKK